MGKPPSKYNIKNEEGTKAVAKQLWLTLQDDRARSGTFSQLMSW
jgi:hypothetical protein